jgi:hypothetical protein
MLEVEEVKKDGPCQYDGGDGGKNNGFSFHPWCLRFILSFNRLSFNGISHLSPLLSSFWDGLFRTGISGIIRIISESAKRGKTGKIQ